MRIVLAIVTCLVAGVPLWRASTVPRSTASSVPEESAQDETLVNFSRDIRPILSDTCFKCHGPDEGQRQAGLRLDNRDNVMDEMMVVEPGEPDSSELYLRLISDDPSSLMPPPESGRVLSKDQIQLIEKWIQQGAQWGQHWSFVTPGSVAPPELAGESWPRNGIDHFVLRQQLARGLRPSEQADKAILVRRAYLDLLGLPPTPEQVVEFVSDHRSDAFERLVDELLASPHYGENMARHWLDVVRYGDTHGLHLDNYREHWPYRDWIINAFNQNKSFRDFSIEQLAGDLVEEPSEDQLIATGYNRAHVTTAEGGSITEEVMVRNVTDRVSTTGTVFLGLTIGCASCHDHKFDPVSQKEFYQLFAYFNSLEGDPMDGNRKDHAPVLMVSTEEQKAQLAQFDVDISALQTEIREVVANWQYIEPDDPPAVVPDPQEVIWLDDELPQAQRKTGAWKFVSGKALTPHSGDRAVVNQSGGQTQYVIQGLNSPWPVTEGDELFAYVYLDPQDPPREIMLQWNDGNWEHRVFWGENLVNFGPDNTPARKQMGSLPRPGEWTRLSVPAADVNLKPGQIINGFALTQFGGKVYWDRVGQITRPSPFPRNRSLVDWTKEIKSNKGDGLPDEIKGIVSSDESQWSIDQRMKLRNHFIEYVYANSQVVLEPVRARLADLEKARNDLRNSIPTTLIYKEVEKPRDAFVLERGLYDQPREQVYRGVPSIFPSLPADAPNDRLGLARWLFSGEHPLTARVAVNRIWQQLFGRGIVETTEDFGSQGRFPSHPDLLDFLANEFVAHDWDVKWLVRFIVTSATYQQSSAVTPELLRADPRNQWLARGARFRLDAEVLRDQALAVSGLLVPTIGGPSVRPPQPDGLWFAVGYSGSNTVRFKKDDGHEKVHRRSMYTFWKRTAPPPQMSTFDAPSRESCTVRRERTNTPLQALLLMNEPQYVEAARHLAQMSMDHFSAEPSDTSIQISWMFQRCLARKPLADELRALRDTADAAMLSFANDPDGAKALISIGETSAPEGQYEPSRLAGWTVVANLIMNMDEFVTRN